MKSTKINNGKECKNEPVKRRQGINGELQKEKEKKNKNKK